MRLISANSSSLCPSDIFLRTIREAPRALERFSKKEWISILNMERDWLKHGGAEEMTFDRGSAAFMIARAMSKFDQWSPEMDEFKIWLL